MSYVFRRMREPSPHTYLIPLGLIGGLTTMLIGVSCWIRTNDNSVNSRGLYHWAKEDHTIFSLFSFAFCLSSLTSVFSFSGMLPHRSLYHWAKEDHFSLLELFCSFFIFLSWNYFIPFLLFIFINKKLAFPYFPRSSPTKYLRHHRA